MRVISGAKRFAVTHGRAALCAVIAAGFAHVLRRKGKNAVGTKRLQGVQRIGEPRSILRRMCCTKAEKTRQERQWNLPKKRGTQRNAHRIAANWRQQMTLFGTKPAALFLQCVKRLLRRAAKMRRAKRALIAKLDAVDGLCLQKLYL